MKILFVCLQYIHAARWINQLKDTEHEIYVFDCLDRPIHKDLLWTNNITGWSKRKVPYLKGEYFLEKKMPSVFNKIEPYLKVTASEKLEALIKELKPDLVHSLEMQSQTYPLLKVRKKIHFKWAYFSWGSDLYLYQNEKKHQQKIKQVLFNLNYLFVDNHRDIDIAKKLGFINEVAGVFPGGGGYQLEKIKESVTQIKKENLIIIKGYHHWAGRALVVLKALDFIKKDLVNYKILVYSAHDNVLDKITEMNSNGWNIEYISRKKEVSQTELLTLFAKAKIAIGNNISDGIPNTLLEAIILGAFPIQSNPGGVSEDYIKDGENGFLIQNPEDAIEISKLISKVLNNEELLDSAFLLNQEIATKLEYNVIRKKVLDAYSKIENKL
ncbi:glycosyltransferase [Polaribacter sp. R2A056_3_33]|uniref:glycosyltransferase n=1 Tax=Polaribacter sp. R2A056_3_33 TaxID=2745563 RepID=UPI001C4F729B|nr:glycosyltransferase [Polaribacter sp. R2A056_3_33]QXP69648.1 glycosyltransferase [Polaribacter sp. R2A056_3_33]